MTSSAKTTLKEINAAVKALNNINEKLENVRNNRDYEKLMNDRVDVLRVAKALAEELTISLENTIRLESEVCGHIGTTRTISEIEQEFFLK